MSVCPMNGSILLVAGANRFNHSIFTLAYRPVDAAFTPADRFAHLLAFFLPGLRLRLGTLTGFCEALGSSIF